MKKPETVLDARGLNAAIDSNLLPEATMRELGFTDRLPTQWYYNASVGSTISLNVSIPKDGSRLSVEVLDDEFGQHYDYQSILKRNPNLPVALGVKAAVEVLMEKLNATGVITGYERGMYI